MVLDSYRMISRWLLPTCFLLSSLLAGTLASPVGFNNSGKELYKKSGVTFAGVQNYQAAGLPIINIENSMSPFEAEVNQEHEQYYFITGSGFRPGQVVLLEVDDPSGSFTISSMMSGYGTIIETVADSEGNLDDMMFVRYAPIVNGGHTATITHMADDTNLHTLTVDGNITALPVEWLSFTARTTKESILLYWGTASEKHNSHFEIEGSRNPLKGFEKIGKVAGNEGIKQSTTFYSYALYPGEESGIWYFRLKQVDIDGKFTYSKIIVIEKEGGGAKLSVVPNPVTASSMLNITAVEASSLSVFILSVGGTEVYRESWSLEKGTHKIPLHFFHSLPTGMYILATELNGRLDRQKLIKK